MEKKRVLRFGIQSLDRLIGTVVPEKEDKEESSIERARYGIDVSDPEILDKKKVKQSNRAITSSICLAGPDGTGKSVLSLHLASQYLADCLTEAVKTNTGPHYPYPKILYISTDLTYKMALKGWNHFALNRPFERSEPLVELQEGINREGPKIEIKLKQYFPAQSGDSSKNVIKYVEGDSYTESPDITANVCFVDLASRTAGDDWGFVHRLLSTLDWPGETHFPHLLILDAVEGFETLVGDLNAFGEKSSRRSRIAQVMRLASCRSHLVLVVEESRQQRFPEEFVTDVVIRLRNVPTPRYLRRTVEVEKARGQWHRRGQHPYVIRSGTGSTTGTQVNADDPRVLQDGASSDYQGYVHVFPSLDDISREVMIDRVDPVRQPDKVRFAAFGLPYLDNMLGDAREKAIRDSNGEFDTRGLPCGSATALIGDSLTQKSQLGKAFLYRALHSFAVDLRRQKIADHLLVDLENEIRDVTDKDHAKQLALKTTAAQVEYLRQQLYKESNKLYPVAVLFTTQDLTFEALADEFYKWFQEDGLAYDRSLEKAEAAIARLANLNISDEPTSQDSTIDELKHHLFQFARETVLRTHLSRHIICRRFEIHDLPGPVLMNIFQRGIEQAQQTMFNRDLDKLPLPKPLERFKDSWRIRVVIDDLNTFRNTYPDMRDDPLMLPSLLFLFGREGVTSLIVDTQVSGSPELSITERFDSSVRQLVQTRIYIWRLPFYGENRVAISVIPPMSHEYRGLIRELRWETKDENQTDRALTVDPHFELYTGLERGEPQPVPLEVRLYCDTKSVARYIETEEKLLREIFTPVLKSNHEPTVIVPALLHEYEPLRDACHVQRDTRLDHTTIIQVNEFWWLKRLRQRRAGAFRPQWNYLSSVAATLRGNKYQSDSVVDPFWVFQPVPAEHSKSARKKRTNKVPDPNLTTGVKRKLDFFDEDCGYYESLHKQADEKLNIDRVPYTWDFGFLLCNGKAWEEASSDASLNSKPKKKNLVASVWNRLRKVTDGTGSGYVSWQEFLQASKIVAEFHAYRTSQPAIAFDFTMLIPESFSCLILEMWLSESHDSLTEYMARAKPEVVSELQRKKSWLESVGRRRWAQDMRNEVSLLLGLEDERYLPLKDILTARKETGEIQSFSLELYKVWLLLTEALNFKDLVHGSSHLDFEFKSRDVTPQAVSARHSYKTACNFIDSLTPEQVEYNWVPVRLPGHFSVRMDWFLAVAGGSRSSRLADHALDLLSSQRANVSRLQEGIGLPTRKLFIEAEEASHLRTRLICAEKGKPLRNIEYGKLRQIGASSNPTSEQFFWLWRSGIWGYNRHSRIWHKWLNRALLWWHSWHQLYGSSWTNGFKVYQLLNDIEFKNSKKAKKEFDRLKLTSWEEFGELRDILIAELEQVSIARE